MKKSLLLLILFLPGILLSQSLTLFDVDASNFPTVRAKFYAFDADGKQILNLSPSDFELLENGTKRKVTLVSCPPPKPPIAISSVLTMDVSGSMGGERIANAKAACRAWVEGLPLGKSECALTTFTANNYFIQDFTTDRNRLVNALQGLISGGGTDFDAGFINPMAGALLAAEKGKYKKVVVFITDGFADGTESAIIQKAKLINATVFCVTLGFGCPPILRNIATQTGGQWYGNVTTKKQAEEVYKTILQTAQGGEPCEIEWESGASCISGLTNVELQITNLGAKVSSSYQRPNTSVAKLEFNPNTVKFLNPEIGVKVEEKVTVTAINADFTVTNITSSNAAFTITPTSFVLNEGESMELTVTYTPTDSSYNFCKFDIESDPCPMAYYAIGSYKGIKPTIQTLKLTHPNGGEIFVVGSDTVITWEGIPHSSKVLLEYSTDNGQSWQTITNNASGLTYKWTNIPRPTSNQCLVRVKQFDNFEDSNSDYSAPQIEWLKTYGGSKQDFANSIHTTSDGGYIVAGNTTSNNGDITENKGAADIWVIKLGMDGSLEWQKTYGGSNIEYATSVQETSDSGYIVAGYTYSGDGDITAKKGGAWDAWILKLRRNGSIQWQRTYGGSDSDYATSIQETRDGGYIVACTTKSNNGDITENKGNVDIWVVKLSIDGNIEWQKTYGGGGWDEAFFIQETSDGGYVIAGSTSSKDIDVLENKGLRDIWILKIRMDGSIEWQKTYGGSDYDYAHAVQETTDGGYIVAGYTLSNDGDVTENKGKEDVWILKLHFDGTIEWQKTYGGSSLDRANSIQETTDGGYIVAGATWSNDGDITENIGESDVWILKLYPHGDIEWQKTYGSSVSELAESIQETKDGGYIVAGWGSDFLVIKLASATILQSDVSDAVFSIVEPIAASRDIDMRQVLVGSAKDSVVNEFVSNVGTWKFRVDSIYIQGTDATAFSLVGGFPVYMIEPDDSYFGEFRFIPNRVGIHTAEVVIVTQAETIVQNIIGKGVEPRIETIAEIIDFGIVDLGQFKDTVQVATIKNISTNPIIITETKHNYPNSVDFSTISGGGNFELQPGQEALMDLRFTANSPGRTSGMLEFHYEGVGSPAVVQLFGEGKFMGVASAQLKTIEIEAFAGDLIHIPIILDYEVELSLSSVNTIDVEMEFNPTLLYPQNLNMEIINDNLAKILIKDLPANKSAGEILGEVAFIVGLGNSETCDITLINPIANGGDADITLKSGHFRLLGVCYEGGTRLLNPYSKAGILSIAPNPADDNLDIVVSLIESGMTELVIYSPMGEKVLTVFSSTSPLNGIQYFNLDTKLLSTGQYYLQLRTPTHIENQIIKIVK